MIEACMYTNYIWTQAESDDSQRDGNCTLAHFCGKPGHVRVSACVMLPAVWSETYYVATIACQVVAVSQVLMVRGQDRFWLNCVSC